MILYNQITDLNEQYIKEKLKLFFEEDMPEEDYTSIATISEDKIITAYIETQEDLVFAGEKVIPHFFTSDYELTLFAKDGDKLTNNFRIAEIKGKARNLLIIERTLLNLIQRLCGIASLTNKFVEIADGKIKILDTRKTIPGLRLFDKYAVRCGGGTNHRLNLSEGILIKDNHITAAGGISNALKSVNKLNIKGLPIELEVDNFEQILEALEIGVDGFLLDNMNPKITKEAVKLIRSHKNGKDVFIESSGGINLSTIANYVNTGIDAVSIGALTHSARSSEIHIEFEI